MLLQRVSQDFNSSRDPDEVVYNPDRNEYLVAWREAFGDATDPIYAQRLSSTGSQLGGLFGVDAQSGDPFQPALAYDASPQKYLMVWVEYRYGTWDIVARSLRADGSGLDGPTVLGTTTGAQTYPAISRQGPPGDHYVVYADDRSSTADVFGLRYLPTQARFSASPASGAAPLSVTFTDRSPMPNADAWLWDFGDGATSTEQNPVHPYTTPGQYTAVFTVTWWDDHTYTTSHLIAVANPVQPQFTASPLNGTRPLTVTFTDESTTVEGTLTAWQWDFGDGVTSTLRNPTHVYPNNGKYDVTLTVGTGTYTNTLTQAGLIVVAAPHRIVINYTYDGLYRLTKADSIGAMTTTFQYAYDAVGNRTTQTATITSTQVTAYQYDAANRLTSVNGQTYTWDDNGNLVNDGAKAYTYDQANRLKSVNGSGVAVTYTYHGDGARLKQIVNGATTTYTLDLATPLVQVLVAKDNSGDTRYVYGVTRIGEQQSAGWLYHLTDALGGVRQLVDGSGNVQLARGYTPYGEPLWLNGTASSRYAFTGEDYDPMVGLVFLRARYMQPTLGIFLARDPWEGDAMRPGSMNGWNYGDDNPANRIDPTGRFSAVAIANGFFNQPTMVGFDRVAGAFSAMSRYPGWISLLLDADESQYVYNWSNLTRREPYGKIKCDEDGHSITRVNEPYTAWRTATDATLFNTNKIPRPRPNLGTWWRDNGVYSLVYGSEEKFYFDKGDDGHANDLPDFIITIGAGWGPGGVAALQDRYGNTYGSGNLGLSVKGGLYLGEGYVSNTWTGFNSRTLVSAYIPTETELQKAIITLGPAANAAAIIGAGVSVNDCDTRYNIGPCYFATLFTTGIQLTVGVNWGATTQPQSKVTEEAWNWMLSEPGPTRDEVWQRWLKSVADNPCGECSAAK